MAHSMMAIVQGKSKHGLTPPVSPSPFMISFNTSQPPTTALPAYPTKMTLRERWQFWNSTRPTTTPIPRQRYRQLKRWLILAAVPATLVFLITAAAIAGRNSLLLVERRITHDPIKVHHNEWRHRRSHNYVNEADLYKRADGTTDEADEPVLSLGGITTDSGSSTTAPTPASSLSFDISESGSGSTGTTPTATVTVAPSVPSNPVLPTPFVQPFDETLSSDFISGSCQLFFANLTQSLEFRQCRPFSLLLPTSQGFLTAQTNLTLLTNIIWGTCNTTPTEDECVGRFDGYQSDIQQQCAQELQAGHAFAWDAFNGFKNYKMYREAACLQNMRTNAYCFADALASNPPSDVYFYQLPLGTPLPGSTGSTTTSASSAKETGDAKGISITPTCSPCTQSLMAVFANYATNSSLLISETYDAAQRIVDSSSNCGSGYAPVVDGGASSRTQLGWTFGVSSILLVLWTLMGF